MKIRMACEWKNLGRFMIDHFAISSSRASNAYHDDVVKSERVEPVHRHYLTCYFKSATYSKSFSEIGYGDNLNSNGQVFPFAEASVVMNDVLQTWDRKLVYPYSEKLSWIRDSDAVAGFQMRWQGAWKSDSFQQCFRRNWEQLENEAYYRPRKNSRLYDPRDVIPDWDTEPTIPFVSLKQLSIASRNGSTEEIARELMMDFLYRLVMTFYEDDLERVFKLTFRLDEETGKESDFGVEISVKGFVDVVVNSWERQLIMKYAEELGWENASRCFELNLFSDRMNQLLERGVSQLPEVDFNGYPKKIRRTLLLRNIRDFFSEKPFERVEKEGVKNAVKESALGREEFVDRLKKIVKQYESYGN